MKAVGIKPSSKSTVKAMVPQRIHVVPNSSCFMLLLGQWRYAFCLCAAGKVGMYAVNCPEWMLVLQACNQMSGMCGRHEPPHEVG